MATRVAGSFLLSILACVLAVLLCACSTPSQTKVVKSLRPTQVVKAATYTGQNPPVPPVVNVRYMFASRPVGDSGLNRDIWRTCDETVLDLETLSRLHEAGLRIGVLSGQPPETLDILLREIPGTQLNGHELHIPSNRLTSIQLGTLGKCPPELAAAIGESDGKPTQPALLFKAVPTLQGDGSVELHVTPTVQYGNIERRYVPEFGPGGVRQWTFENKRKEHEFTELSFRVRLRSDQTLLLTCDPDRKNTLGWFFFVNTSESPPSQTLLVIQAFGAQD